MKGNRLTSTVSQEQPVECQVYEMSFGSSRAGARALASGGDGR